MPTDAGRTVVVMGATGRQGGAVARELLKAGWDVRAITRKPEGRRARALQELGADVRQADMSVLESLRPVMQGAHAVFSLQNPAISGPDGERQQARNVADAAKQANVDHVVYASAGPGEPGTGVLQWDFKLQAEVYMRELGLPLTVLRPMALMELMTDKSFYPAASTWSVMPRLAGADTPIPWISAQDVGSIAALVFEDPDRFLGEDLHLASDMRSLNQCAAIYEGVMGRRPRRIPMPVWMLERFAGSDVTRMWRWLRVNGVSVDPGPTRSLLPAATSVEAWLGLRRA